MCFAISGDERFVVGPQIRNMRLFGQYLGKVELWTLEHHDSILLHLNNRGEYDCRFHEPEVTFEASNSIIRAPPWFYFVQATIVIG